MTAEPVDAAPAPATPEPPLTFRPDVEGLRGVAVLLVLLFHVGLPVPGGFVGVDLFFVISGFLITGLLLREHERTGRVSFGRFYARRIRRLLPAAAVIIVVTLAASMVVVGPLDRPEVMADGAAAALSVVNVRYALAEGDYFAALLRPTPLLHLWSLSVEEQFYLLWPALLFLVARGRRAWVGLTLAIVLAGSFVANLWLTDHTIAWAFYSLPTRAWQLALGGLIAVAATALRRIPWPLLAPAGWIGLGAIGASAILLGATPYPGVYALAPTIGGVLLIAAGEARLGPGRLLSIPPLRWVGRISYSLYLWHWPILVLAPVALRAELPLEARIGLGVVAIGVAWLSWRFVEEPFRHGRLSVVLGTRRALATGLATVALVAVAATGLQIGSLRAIDAIAAAEPVPTASPASFSTPAPSDPEPSPTPSSGSSGAPSVEPSTEPSAEPSPTPAPTPDLPPLPTWREIPNEQPAAPIPLVAGIRPSLSDARTDSEPIYRDGCGARVDDLVPQECVYGDRSGAFTVALVGDSHAGMWFPAIDVLARSNGWRLVPYVKQSCPFIDMRVEHFALKREYTECATWNERVVADLNAHPPDLTIVAWSHRGIFPILAEDATAERQSQAIAREIERLPGPVAVMVDTPRTSVDIPGCIAEHPDDVRACAISRSVGFDNLFGVREARVAALSGAAVVDIVAAVCPAMPCQVIRDGMILYRDNHHLSATFSVSLAPVLAAQLARTVPSAFPIPMQGQATP